MIGRLAGKVALITGTASGQGRAAALLFAAEDATVVGTDVNADGAAETMALVRARDGRMDSTHPLDLNIVYAPSRSGESGPPRKLPAAPCSSPATRPPMSQAPT